MKNKSIKKALLIGCLFFAACSASANPIRLGYITDGQPSSDANEIAWVEHLLDVPLGSETTSDIGGNKAHPIHTYYRNSNVDPGNGVLGIADKSADGDLTVDAGSEYVYGKYGNVGVVVWYTGGVGFTLPATWTLATGIEDNGGGLSHHTTFGTFIPTVITVPVPEGGSAIAMFGLGLTTLGLGFIRNKNRAAA